MPSRKPVVARSSLAPLKSLRHALLPVGSNRPQCISDAEPLVIAGMFRTANGVGQAARRFVLELQERGYSPIPVDLSDLFNQVDAHTKIDLKQMPRKSSGTLILFANAPETRLALRALQLRRWHNWRIIGYWSWELETPPDSWLKVASHLSEIWTPSDFVRNAFQKRVNVPVRTVPIPVTAPPIECTPHSEGEGFKCLAMADGRSSFHRKNLIAATRMFVRAFDTDTTASLTVKLRNGGEFPAFMTELNETIGGHSGVTIVDRSIPHDDRWKLIADHDVTISAHRSEGFGLSLAESMAMGKCAIATGWSGNTQFMTQLNSVLLPFALEDVTDPYGVYSPSFRSKWARVEEDAGIEALRALQRSPDKLASIGANAKADVQRTLNGDAMINALAQSPLAA